MGCAATVAVLVVVVTAAATGSAVALSSPSLLAALHPAPAADAPPPLPRLALGPLAASAPLPTESGLGAALGAPADAVPGTFTGLVLDPASDKVLWQRTPATPLVPGSTAKLITTSAALLTLNPTSSLVTRVVAGAEPGTVVLVGGGDPTLTALPPGKVGVYPDPARLTELAAQVKKATGGARHQGGDRHEPLPRARASPRAGTRATSRAATSPRSPRSCSTAAASTPPSRTARGYPTPRSRPGWRSRSCWGWARPL